MVTPGGTFERVLAGLRQRLASGAFALGDPLEPATLAQDLNASITPVRDALHRLVGERLVETAPGGGFRFPLLTEVGVRYLYDWRHRLLVLAIGQASRENGDTSDFPATVDDADLGPRLFEAIARLAANPECTLALMRVAGRLEPLRRKEEELLGAESVASDIAALVPSLSAGDWTSLRRGLLAHHRRRMRIVGELVAALHRPPLGE